MASTESTRILLDFDGRKRPFQLRLGEIEALEQACKAGIAGIATRLITHQFYAADVWDTIRFGLVGAGMDETDATAKLSTFREKPVGNYAGIAAKIIEAALSGVDEPEPGKDEAAGANLSPVT